MDNRPSMAGHPPTPPAQEQLVYRYHARQRMAERGITDEAVRVVLETYDTHRPARASRGATNPSEIYIGPYNGRRLKVYVERGSNPRAIKTAVWEGD